MEVAVELLRVLERSVELGHLGGDPMFHVEHAQGFLNLLPGSAASVVDLGSGGGVPGLVLGWARPDLELCLLDGSVSRCAFLTWACEELRLARTRVWCGRAEVAGRDDAFRGAMDVVVARAFGAPAVLAECAAPLLRTGGRLIVSEPPEGEHRWPAAGLATLGLEDEGAAIVAGARFRVLVSASPVEARFPRRVGVPAKRPLF